MCVNHVYSKIALIYGLTKAICAVSNYEEQVFQVSLLCVRPSALTVAKYNRWRYHLTLEI